MAPKCQNPSPSSSDCQQPDTPPAWDESVEQYLLSNETSRLLRHKARRLVARAGLPMSELEEIVQALHAVLVQASRFFDPERGAWSGFAERSLQYAVNNFKRHRYTESRNPRRCVSLDIQVKVRGEDDVRELAQLVTADDLDARTGGRTIDEFERADLRMDLADFLATLPPMLRELADALGPETIQSISRRTGVPRPTVYDRVERIRKLAEDAGLAKYLE